MKVNPSKRSNLYTTGRRFAARVLFIVWLLVSCSPGNTLADSKCQVANSGSVSLTVLHNLATNSQEYYATCKAAFQALWSLFGNREVKGPKSVTDLLEDLENEEHSVRQAAVAGFGKLERIDSASLAALHELMTNPQAYYATRKAAVQTLEGLLESCQVTDPEPECVLKSVRVLLKALDDIDINVREAAGFALRQIRVLGPATFAVLEEAAEDPSWDVREVAQQVLKEVTVAQ